MKQILFRGVDAETREITYGSLLRPAVGRDIIVKEGWSGNRKKMENDVVLGHEEIVRCLPGSVGQFTGARDRSGNRIFEGDIVRMSFRKEVEGENGESPSFESGDFVGAVVMTGRGVQLNPVYVITERERKSGCGYSATSYKTITARRSQVIGNVFWTPDWKKKLLK